MKMKRVNPAVLLLFGTLSLCILGFSSCKSDSPEAKPGALSLHIHTMVDTAEVEDYGGLLNLPGGRAISVTMAQLYISNVKLIKTDGGVVDGPSTVVLVQQGIEDYDLGDVPSGNYKSVRFDIGLSNTDNASTPSSSDHALYQPTMWFGSTPQPEGFVFINFQGSVDTTTNANGSQLIPFVYKIGTNEHRVTVTLPDQPYTVVPDELTVIHLSADYGKLLNGIPLNKIENLNIATAEANAWSWIVDIETNMAAIIQYEF